MNESEQNLLSYPQAGSERNMPREACRNWTATRANMKSYMQVHQGLTEAMRLKQVPRRKVGSVSFVYVQVYLLFQEDILPSFSPAGLIRNAQL